MSGYWAAIYSVLFIGYIGAVIIAVAVVATHALLDYLDAKADHDEQQR